MQFKNIIVGFDGTATSKEVLKRTFSLAKDKNTQVAVVHVIETTLLNTFFSNKSSDAVKQEIMLKISQIIQELNTFNVQTSIIVSSGNPAEKIISRAKKIKADLVVVGTNSKNSLYGKEFGSVSHKVIQKCQIPFLIVKNKYDKEYKNILAFSDLTDVSKEGILFVKSLFPNAKYKLVHAYKQISNFTLSFYNAIEAKDSLQKDVKSSEEKSFEEFSEILDFDEKELIEAYYSVNEALFEASKTNDSDLIILGAYRVKKANSIFQGSTSTYLMEKVQSDVLVYLK